MSTDYFVYVLQNEVGKFYIGLTECVEVRLHQHNTGVSKWTRNKGPWRVVWMKGPLTLAEAKRLELYLKRQKGGQGCIPLLGGRA
jgi:putative endonuclease